MAKKNFRKGPDQISRKLNQINPNNVVVSCVTKLTVKAIRKGEYESIGIVWKKDRPEFPASVVPDGDAGKYSNRNAHGQEITRTDLPMVTKTFYMETPNFGDWSKGSHSVA